MMKAIMMGDKSSVETRVIPTAPTKSEQAIATVSFVVSFFAREDMILNVYRNC
jgi:hypothetical protein